MIQRQQSTEDRLVRHRHLRSKSSALARGIALGLVVAALAIPRAASAFGPDAPVELTARDVQLLVKPSATDLSSVYPRTAARKRLAGEALVRCTVSDDRRLSDCRVVNETPSGQGFGEAALRLATVIKLKETTRTGEPTAGRSFLFPLKFQPSR